MAPLKNTYRQDHRGKWIRIPVIKDPQNNANNQDPACDSNKSFVPSITQGGTKQQTECDHSKVPNWEEDTLDRFKTGDLSETQESESIRPVLSGSKQNSGSDFISFSKLEGPPYVVEVESPGWSVCRSNKTSGARRPDDSVTNGSYSGASVSVTESSPIALGHDRHESETSLPGPTADLLTEACSSFGENNSSQGSRPPFDVDAWMDLLEKVILSARPDKQVTSDGKTVLRQEIDLGGKSQCIIHLAADGVAEKVEIINAGSPNTQHKKK